MDRVLPALLVTIIAILQIGAGSQETDKYIFGFPNNFGSISTYVRIIVTTTSSKNEQIIVSSFDGVFFSGHVSASQPAIVDVPKKLVVLSGWMVDREKGICLTTSSKDLSVVAVNSYNPLGGTQGTTASFKVLPYKKLAAKEYIYHAVSTDSVTDKYSSEILLVAYEDNTEISIASPNISLNLPNTFQKNDEPHNDKKYHSITLDRMQTLLIKHSSHDLTGILISSNNQLAVISGHECGNVPADKDFCDHLLVQVPPTYSWGKEFLLFPMDGRKAGQNYKVVASQDRTSFSLYCKSRTESDIELGWKGSFREFHTGRTEHCSVVSDKPVLVALLGLGFAADQFQGDPSMVLIPPISDFSENNVFFHTMNGSQFESQYVTIVTPSNEQNLELNGVKPWLFHWKPIPGPGGAAMGYQYTKQLLPQDLNGINKLTSSGSRFAAFVYGFSKSPKHSYSYRLSQDQLSPETVPVLSLHKGSMVELEESAMFPIGLGRVDVIDTELTVDVVITGCSSTEESSLAMPAGIPNDFALAGVAIGTSNNIQIRLSVTFAPGEAEKIIEAIKLVDDQWSEPVKAIRVEFDHFSDPVKIMGYDETIISLLDDDALKIGVSVEKSTDIYGSSDDIMITVEVSEGQLLPGEIFQLALEGEFLEGNVSKFSKRMDLSCDITSRQIPLTLNCSMGSCLKTRIKVDPITLEKRIPFNIGGPQEWFIDSCSNNTIPLDSSVTTTETKSASLTTTTTTTHISSQSHPTSSISQASSLLPLGLYSSSTLLITTSPSSLYSLPVHTTSSSFMTSHPQDSTMHTSISSAIRLPVPTQTTVLSLWGSSSHLVSSSSLPIITPSPIALSHSHTLSSSLKLSLSSSSLSIPSIISSPAIITNLHILQTVSTETPFPSSKLSFGTVSFSLSSSTTSTSSTPTGQTPHVIQPSSSLAQDSLTLSQDQSSSIALYDTVPNSHSSNSAKHSGTLVEASPTIASIGEDTQESGFVPTLVGVLIAVAVVTGILITLILLLLRTYRRRKCASWSPHTPVVLVRILQNTDHSVSFEKV